MTNEQINRLVAEELGWTQIRSRYVFGPALLGTHPNGKARDIRVPDFCNDHNAVAEMRNGIVDPVDRLSFTDHLDEVLGLQTYPMLPEFAMLNSTPRQQAEAFLRMRGKWMK